ncbi:hypothetical protein [Chromobacterium subtsugae]|uniref:hypothetical protein n=1 Tax=Chromobacterium subtsugae TaxID=251747 RepID=UPI000AD2E159|nr:hypothetical protein [Chromobacterium subtsugae]
MTQQNIEHIDIEKLILWSENPRDPISPNSSNEEIISNAIADRKAKWALRNLANQMGDFFDQSEIPTVAYIDNKPVVFDGNRRVILGKIFFDRILSDTIGFTIPQYPKEIPCNVCDEKTAIASVARKHLNSGSWSPLERDLFLHKFMKQPKTVFLIFNEITKLIEQNPDLNKVFVRDEILTPENLRTLGFRVNENETLQSKHSPEEAKDIFADIIDKIKTKQISTRNNRGRVSDTLSDKTIGIVQKNSTNKFRDLDVSPTENQQNPEEPIKRLTKITKETNKVIFGEKLQLRAGDVNNLYRDIVSIHILYKENKAKFSSNFSAILRMALRLICETAAKEFDMNLEKFVKSNFNEAKSNLNQDTKTTLLAQNITETSIIPLLQMGAHNYTSSKNIEQNMAISYIIGQIIQITHRKK